MLVGAFVPYAVAMWHVSRNNWTPLDYPVQLHRGEIQTPEFTSEVAGTYILFLQIQPRRMEFQRQECLLDLESFHPERCSAIPSVVESSWKLWSGPNQVADNTTEQTWKAGSYSNDYTRREIGRFRARQGERYRLSIDFRRDPSELNAANPKLVAESIQDWEGFAIETQGTFALGVLLAIVALVLLIVSGKRRQPTHVS